MDANIKIGASCSIKVTGADPVELIKNIAQFSQLPTKCGHCDSADLGFRHRTAGASGEYSYLTLHCNDCGAALDVGQQKVGGGIFPTFRPKDANKNDKVNVRNGFYKWKDQPHAQSAGQAQPTQSQPSASDDGDDDIPF